MVYSSFQSRNPFMLFQNVFQARHPKIATFILRLNNLYFKTCNQISRTPPAPPPKKNDNTYLCPWFLILFGRLRGKLVNKEINYQACNRYGDILISKIKKLSRFQIVYNTMNNYCKILFYQQTDYSQNLRVLLVSQTHFSLK